MDRRTLLETMAAAGAGLALDGRWSAAGQLEESRGTPPLKITDVKVFLTQPGWESRSTKSSPLDFRTRPRDRTAATSDDWMARPCGREHHGAKAAEKNHSPRAASLPPA